MSQKKISKVCFEMVLNNNGIKSRGGVGAGGLEYKKVGVLVVSLRGVNFRFLSRLGC